MTFYTKKLPREWKKRKTIKDTECIICRRKIKKGEQRIIVAGSDLCLECYDEFMKSPEGTFLGNISRARKYKNKADVNKRFLFDGINHIEDALYATGRFTTIQCSQLADGIMQYIKDGGYALIRVDNNVH